MPDPERDRSGGLTGEAYAEAVAGRGSSAGPRTTPVCSPTSSPRVAWAPSWVWGDPAIYDGTLRILEGLDLPLNVVSVPGISAIQALAAAHRLVLNRTGGAITVTTGRRLAREGMIGDDVVVMLDARCAFAGLPDAGVDIFWGAYLGTPDEVLVAGDLAAVKDEIRGGGVGRGNGPARDGSWTRNCAAALNVLLLGGTAEGRRLAAAAVVGPEIALTSSLAGAVDVPFLPRGRADRRVRRCRGAHRVVARPPHRRRRGRHPSVRDADDGVRGRRHGRLGPAAHAAAQARLGCRSGRPLAPGAGHGRGRGTGASAGRAGVPRDRHRRRRRVRRHAGAGSCCARSTHPSRRCPHTTASSSTGARSPPTPSVPCCGSTGSTWSSAATAAATRRGQARRGSRVGPSGRHGGPTARSAGGGDRRDRRRGRGLAARAL